MKISVVTITCREQPRFAELLKTLLASFSRRTHADTELEWIVVDERATFHLDAIDTRDPRWAFIQGVAFPDGFSIRVRPPLASPFRATADKLPAHNSARNAGLEAAGGDYIMFVNDCTVVTRDWVATCELVAGAGHGWRVKSHIVNDMALPHDGVLKYRDHYDRLRPVQANAVPGACWGAPRAAFLAIGGFDVAYDGEDKCHDLDAVIRLERAGVAFVTTERAFCVRLRRTKTQGEITLRKESLHGARNQKLLQDLLRDSTRRNPRRGDGAADVADPSLAAVAPSAPPAPAARSRAAEARALRVARAQRARPAARAVPRAPRATRPGYNATPVKGAGRLRPPKPLPPPVQAVELELGDIADATGFDDDEIDGLDALAAEVEAEAAQSPTSGDDLDMAALHDLALPGESPADTQIRLEAATAPDLDETATS